ncbi:MAG: ppk1, partial [Chitinophagaceae bacterium]|nr:ppk1 [Chitinophagaceae bacterium]
YAHQNKKMKQYRFFDRDLSWLSFNERVLMEAGKEDVPLIERIKFLSIFSSNLDEFYRVRMPAVMALSKLHKVKKKQEDTINETGNHLEEVTQIILRQQQYFGSLLTGNIIPALKEKAIYLVYNETLPEITRKDTTAYFFNTLSAFIQIIYLNRTDNFFPENNKLYIAVTLEQNGKSDIALINIPSDTVSRFYNRKESGTNYIIFTDDIIKDNLQFIFPQYRITGSFSLKITRDAELDLLDEYEGDLAEKIEKQISKRDFGLATRFLYQPDLPLPVLERLIHTFNLSNANIIPGGNYHNLKDLMSIPVHDMVLEYPGNPASDYRFRQKTDSLFREIQYNDILIHTPYNSYNTVLRFFNEAAMDDDVEEIYTTLYRVASDSRIVYALISAAKNGKSVTVFVELKARFDEANNIKWAKRMKAAGVKIIYSIPHLKVHAKVALVKKKQDGRQAYLGLLATGNLNESTARFYTDHILLTASGKLLRELELLFIFLSYRKKAESPDKTGFKHLLVAQFNLQKKFLDLMDNEIANAKKGLPSGITIKLNNLEEEILISKLYEASNAGVRINLIIRSVCCLIPGVPGMSENISVKRIVDRYLEHGRIFMFHNNNNELIYLGSSDWMNRNIYRKIEVCFPLYDEELKNEIKTILSLQLQDNLAAVILDETMNNVPAENDMYKLRSQEAIYQYCLKQINNRKTVTRL